MSIYEIIGIVVLFGGGVCAEYFIGIVRRFRPHQ